MALSLDGVAAGTSATSVISATLTTTQSNDIIVATVSNFTNSSYANPTFTLSGGGLTWTRRSVQFTNTSAADSYILEVWWAKAASPLSSVTITATLDAHYSSINYSSLIVFGVNGVDQTNPFDPNSSLPATLLQNGAGSALHPVTPISTTNANTFEFAALGSFQTSAVSTSSADTGFTLLGSQFDTYNSFSVEGIVHSSTLSGATQDLFSATLSAITGDYLAYVDALQAVGGGGPSPTGTLGPTEVGDTASFAGTVVTPPVSGLNAFEVADTASFSGIVSGQQFVSMSDQIIFPIATEAYVFGQVINVPLSDAFKFLVGREFWSPVWGKPVTVTPGGVGLHPTQSQLMQRTASLRDLIRLHQAQSASGAYSLSAQERIILHDALALAFPVVLHPGNLGTHDALKVVWSLSLLGGIQLHPALAGSGHHNLAISDRLQIGSALGRLLGATLSEGVHLHAALTRAYVANPLMVEGVGFHDVATRTLLVSFTLNEGIELEDNGVLQGLYRQTYQEGMTISAAYISPGGGLTTWAINTRTGATTEYQNYNFNSFTRVGSKYLGASSQGLFELDGDTDNGVPIIADILGGFAQFGGSKFASIKEVYIGMRGSGSFILKIIEGDGNTRAYGVSARNMKTTRVDVGKGLRARYFAYELISTGQDFDLDSLEFVPLVMTRRV